MKTITKISLRKAIISILLALATSFGIGFVAFTIMFTVPLSNRLATIFMFLTGLSIAICCFFIVRQNPSSVWYVPVISNIFFILLSFSLFESDEVKLWIPFFIGWL